MARPLVFVSCGVTTRPLLPLLAARATLVIPDGGSAERLCGAGVRALAWDALADPARLAALPARAAALASAWHDGLAARAPALFGFGGRVRADEALAAVDAMLASRLEGQLAALEFGRALVATGRLAAVVLHEDVTGPVRAFLAAVRPAGVPTIHVPHGLYADDRVVGGDVHGAAHTDWIAAGGVVQRDWFVRRGVDPGRIVVSGNPAWDPLCALPRSPLPDLAPGPVVTVAASWLGRQVAHHAGVSAQHERWVAAALAAVARLRRTRPTLRLVLKLHPSAPDGEEARLRAVAAEAGAPPDLVVRAAAPEVLAASDVLVTLPSTIAVEALLVGTPVVSPEFCYDGDAVLSVRGEPESLAATLALVLDGWGRSADFAARRRTFLARHNGACDGRAGERVAGLVEDVAARRVVPAAAPDAAARHLGAARLLVAARYPASALVVLDEGAASDAAADVVRGEALLQLGCVPDAEAAFRRALAADAEGRAHAGLGLLLLERGTRTEAAALLEEAVVRGPALDGAWCGLGVLAALDGRVGAALALLGRALALNPANPDARRALAVCAGATPLADAPV